jgi:hypothetical protein
VAFRSVVEPVAPFVAHRGDDVAAAHVITDELEHRAPPVTLEPVPDPDSQPQQRRPGVRGGKPLSPVALRERNEVCDLLPLNIDDLHQLAYPGDERRAGGRPGRGRRDDDALYKGETRTVLSAFARCRQRCGFSGYSGQSGAGGSESVLPLPPSERNMG